MFSHATIRASLAAATLLLLLPVTSTQVRAETLQGRQITFQGRLYDTTTGALVNTTVEAIFRLYDAQSGGNVLVTVGPRIITITDGLFVVNDLDFGDQFKRMARWIEVEVDDTILAPRLAVSPTPFALALPGLRTENFGATPAVLGGHESNALNPGAWGAVIAGGGYSGAPNRIHDQLCVIAGGANNTAGTDDGNATNGVYATVGGGHTNRAEGLYSVIAGGHNNHAIANDAFIGSGFGHVVSGGWALVTGGLYNEAQGDYSAVGGGKDNIAEGAYNTIGGGLDNITGQSTCADGIDGGGETFPCRYATIGGGEGNRATDSHATVAGGEGNNALAAYAAVGGGLGNSVLGLGGTVPGGVDNNAIGHYSLAAGRNATAFGNGTFVWNDDSGNVLSETAANRFSVRASGGFKFFTSATGGAILSAGSGSWASFSDRTAKEDVEPVDPKEVLAAVMELPIARWSYIAEDGVRHLGPMAQDFHAAFNLGPDERHITSVDADGVALAAIQGLHRMLDEKDGEIETLRGRNDELHARLAAIETMVRQLTEGDAR